MSRPDFLKLVERIVPRRVLVRASVQVLRARMAVRSRMRRSEVGPGMPIVGIFEFGEDQDWRSRLIAAMVALSHEASFSVDRFTWLMCVGFPPDAPDEVYALSVQAAPLVQLHMFADAGELQSFAARYVPPASLREAKRQKFPSVPEILSRPREFEGLLNRATSARASGHVLVKQLGGAAIVLAVHATAIGSVISAIEPSPAYNGAVTLLVVDHPPDSVKNTRLGPLMARHMGFSLLDELALLRFCDGYVGPANHYAIMAVDAGVRCLVSGMGASTSPAGGEVTYSGSLSLDVVPWLERQRAYPGTKSHSSP